LDLKKIVAYNKKMKLDVNNFDNYTADEYRDNLLRLGAVSHGSFVGKKVYYSKKEYGEHKVIKWDADRAEFLLDFEGQRFWSNPFMIQNCE
jgi:hypothetical protein